MSTYNLLMRSKNVPVFNTSDSVAHGEDVAELH
jgi:hypothetical protein